MVTVEHLTKYYGDFLALDDLSFEIGEGLVYGLLGPNGAGKSTTMNIMTGCLSATSGSVKIDGHDIFEEPEEAKKLIGYLPEQPPLYMNETPLEYLRFVGRAKGLKGQELKDQIARVIELTKIDDVKHRLISKLSKGYKQRVGIAQALIGNPRVIILDEPTVGLDPLQIIEIRDLIKELGKTSTVILSSHILSEVQTICEQVLIISRGHLVAFDTPEELEKLFVTSSAVSFTAEATKEEAEEILAELDLGEWSITGEEDGTISVQVNIGEADSREASRRISVAFAKREHAVIEINTHKANLEDVFIEITEAGATSVDSAAAELPELSVDGDEDFFAEEPADEAAAEASETASEDADDAVFEEDEGSLPEADAESAEDTDDDDEEKEVNE